MRRQLIPVLLLALGACNDPSTPSETPVFTVSPTTQWSGGEFRVTSGSFVGSQLPVLVAGAETLAVHRLSDSTVAVALPMGPTGSVVIDLLQGRHRFPVETIQRIGYHGVQVVSPAFEGELVTSANGTAPIIVGGSYAAGGRGSLQALNVTNLLLTSYPGIFGAEFYGVSPTRQANEFVVADSQFKARRWRLWPVPGLIDTPPQLYGSLRHLAQFSDSVWLSTGSHNSNTFLNKAGVFGGFGLQTESVWSVFISPTGNTATIAVAVGRPGVPVFNTATGDTLYTLGEGFVHGGWAAYSADGEQIFFLGGKSSGANDSLLAIRAATGEILAEAALSATAINLVADPQSGLLYVESLIDGLPNILVFEPATLTLIGRLPGDSSGNPARCSITCFEGAMAIDPFQRLLRVVWTGGPEGSPVWTFDLLH